MKLTENIYPATRKTGLYLAALIGVSLVLYAVSLRNGFVWDAEIVIKDPTVREFRHIPSYFTEDTLSQVSRAHQGRVTMLKYYRPLLKTVNCIQYNLFGESAFGYNATNILLNAAVVALAFLFIRNALQSDETAFLAALIYAVNPSRVEAVSWIYSISNLLMAFLCLLSLVLYQRGRLLPSLLSFAAALLVRETSLLLPVVIFLYEFFLRRQRALSGYRNILYFLLVCAVYLAVRQSILGSPPLSDLDPEILLNAIAVILKRYVKIFFLPDAAVTVYPFTLFSTLQKEVIISYAAVACILFGGILIWIRKKELMFWYLWFFAWLGFSFNAGRYADYLMAEKELYLSSAGFSVIIASLASNQHARNRLLSFILIIPLLAAHAGITFYRNVFWKDSITYLEKLVEFAPDFYLTRFALADYYTSEKDYDRALEQYQKTVGLFPKNTLAYNDMGNIYYIKGRTEKAMEMWHKAIEADESYPQPYYNIGMVMEKRGMIREALNYYGAYLGLATEVPGEIREHVRDLKKKENPLSP